MVQDVSWEWGKYLWCYLGLRGNDLGHNMLWASEEGRPLTKHGVQEIIRRLKREAGLQGLRGSVHKLRHTGATVTLKHTRDMKGLKLLLGHSTLAMTERYTQFIDADDAHVPQCMFTKRLSSRILPTAKYQPLK